MIPICPLRDEILLFLWFKGFITRALGASWWLVPPCSPGAGGALSECWSLPETNQETFYMQIQRELGAPCRDERIQMEEPPAAPPSIATSTHHQDMENSWFFFIQAGYVRVLLTRWKSWFFGGFSSLTVDIINPHSIVMAGKEGSRPDSASATSERYLLNRVGSKYLRKCTIK